MDYYERRVKAALLIREKLEEGVPLKTIKRMILESPQAGLTAKFVDKYISMLEDEGFVTRTKTGEVVWYKPEKKAIKGNEAEADAILNR